ncbi:siderophore-interacting protein [Altererythrobacter xixiisoli]|uniref:Siderophore-interacting protein n=1 Tax=Croceibacterium xixiisoli TaxID=1476466 RepID=A0A6I4TTH3_9SPHN|nr:siderophore-interacting protein [Croceibacterium xixiisoli]MXO99475.1 siderophore-interacting protein [Croceibacterium xixiisoli]
MAPPNRPPPRLLQVLDRTQVTPNMLRLTLGGPGLEGFPAGQAGGYVKLRLPTDGGKVVVRTYTIRAQTAETIDVDFALHAAEDGADGPATAWALGAQVGDPIELGGPGAAKLLPDGHDFYLLLGDMTALPAISVNLELLPADARGLAVIEILTDEDRQDLARPEGVEIRWLVNPHPGTGLVLPAEVAQLAWPNGNPYAWSASEFSSMQALRRILRDERGLGPDRLYISSYWKSGLTEEAHKVIKSEDALSL